MKSSPPHPKGASSFWGVCGEDQEEDGCPLAWEYTLDKNRISQYPPRLPHAPKPSRGQTLRFLWCWIQYRAEQPKGKGIKVKGTGHSVQCLVQCGASTRQGTEKASDLFVRAETRHSSSAFRHQVTGPEMGFPHRPPGGHRWGRAQATSSEVPEAEGEPLPAWATVSYSQPLDSTEEATERGPRKCQRLSNTIMNFSMLTGLHCG